MSIAVRLRADRTPEWEAGIGRLVSEDIVSRLVERDPTIWGEDAKSEAAIRLGWLNSPEDSLPLLDELERLREDLNHSAISSVVLCGMGGSSLAPEVMALRDGVKLTIVDSTHPDHLAMALARDLRECVVVVSSKSGGTVETAAARAIWEEAFRAENLDPREHIVVVTDPGSPLEKDALAEGYRVVLADPLVGGRFSALTAFGVVPTVLSGVDVRKVIAEASEAIPLLTHPGNENPAIRLAAALATHRDIAVLLPDGASPGLADWIEQLVAESTGKQGLGLLPVVASTREAAELRLDLHDVLVVDLGGEDPESSGADIAISAPLGAQFVLWEYATALLGFLLEINPFDQPDVESAKVAARALLENSEPRPVADFYENAVAVWNAPGHPAGSMKEAFSVLRSALGQSGYLSVQLYANRLARPVPDTLRNDLVAALGRPVTLGFGPRFLHSTGQFHKGGSQDGVFLQIEQEPMGTLAIPGFPFDCAGLIDAQAAGDRQVLTARGRPVVTIRIPADADWVDTVRELASLR
jgi:glucose-6-phosphate isomerase